MSDGRAYFVQLYRLDDEESVAEDDTAAGTNATASEAVPSSKASTTSVCRLIALRSAILMLTVFDQSSSHRPSHQLEEYTYGMSEEAEGALARQDVAWEGTCIHGAHPTLNSVSQGGVDAEPDNSNLDEQRMAEILSADLDRTLVLDNGSQDDGGSVAGDLEPGDCATFASLNYKFSLVAVGTQRCVSSCFSSFLSLTLVSVVPYTSIQFRLHRHRPRLLWSRRCLIGHKQALCRRWNGHRMDMPLLLAGRKVGGYGVLVADVSLAEWA